MDIRLTSNGELWSIQVHDFKRAPGSGWCEIARVEEEGHALTISRLPFETIEAIGNALAHARDLARVEGAAGENARWVKKTKGWIRP